MHATRAQTHRPRASHVIAAALQFIATTFVMHVMVGCPSRQLKMPCPDAYELAAALPSDRAAGVVTAIGNRLTERLCDVEIDEPTDDAMVSDLAPILAALRHPLVQRQPN